MSMISSLIDKLNKSADEWNGSNMFELARMCREAADTIWELRDALQRANAANTKLREYVTKLEQDNHRLDSDNCELRNDMRDMQFFIDENRRLRELCADMTKMLVLACWASVESDEEASQCIRRAEALGIEVEG